MHNLLIRKAKSSDLPVLNAFQQGIIKSERPFDPQIADDPISYYDLAAMIDDDQTCLAVAEIDGEVAGSGYAQLRPAKPYVRQPRISYLGFMFVPPHFRGRGINKAVLEYLEKWSQDQGVKVLHLEVYPENEPALRAYEKAQYQSYLVRMQKIVD